MEENVDGVETSLRILRWLLKHAYEQRRYLAHGSYEISIKAMSEIDGLLKGAVEGT